MREKKNAPSARFIFHLRAREKREKRRWATVSRVTTRAQKRRMGERDDLWDVVVNNDDICFKHILPRLNRTDLKFLYDVNSETRALIKRSSRKDELEERFEVKQMSSISTLEIAWENQSSWREGMYEKSFCSKVARTNKLELLRWIREEKKCEWDVKTSEMAAEQGNLEMLKYCVGKECPVDGDACARAAESGSLECLKYLKEVGRVRWHCATATCAAKHGHIHILKYLNECDYYDFYDYLSDENACVHAAANGHLDCLKYLHEEVYLPLDVEHPYEDLEFSIDEVAAENGHLHILEYLVGLNYSVRDRDACFLAAQNGHLDCLRYLHEVAKAPLDFRWIAERAAENGNLHILKYLVECGFDEFDEDAYFVAELAASYGHLHILEYLVERGFDEFDEDACASASAARNGHLDCLKYLHEVAGAPLYSTAAEAAGYGHLHILEYLVEIGFDEFEFEKDACFRAAKNGHLDCLKFLHKVAKAPWDSRAVESALLKRKCLHYLLDNNCPLPEGWRYEHETLYTEKNKYIRF
jgi:ankyrin repeat protein